ncbi:MAG: two pore domain potassium channel family protein [Clostridia bacterium]|nr:two pore domain potassium channel family protein [Clostridia bacterium]
MRKKIYRMVHIYDGSLPSIIYKYFMIAVIVASMLPLVTKATYRFFGIIEIICLIIFIIDYLLRWFTADYKFENAKWTSFIRYPLRAVSIIDFVSIMALAIPLFDLFGAFASVRVLAVFRMVRIFRYSKNVRRIFEILKRSKKSLLAVCGFAVGYIVISAIVIFNVEGDSFKTFFDAVYWATMSLTTVGYGDIYPVSDIGRVVAMISSFFGIAVVALPAGIISAEYIKSLDK